MLSQLASRVPTCFTALVVTYFFLSLFLCSSHTRRETVSKCVSASSVASYEQTSLLICETFFFYLSSRPPAMFLFFQ